MRPGRPAVPGLEPRDRGQLRASLRQGTHPHRTGESVGSFARLRVDTCAVPGAALRVVGGSSVARGGRSQHGGDSCIPARLRLPAREGREGRECDEATGTGACVGRTVGGRQAVDRDPRPVAASARLAGDRRDGTERATRYCEAHGDPRPGIRAELKPNDVVRVAGSPAASTRIVHTHHRRLRDTRDEAGPLVSAPAVGHRGVSRLPVRRGRTHARSPRARARPHPAGRLRAIPAEFSGARRC